VPLPSHHSGIPPEVGTSLLEESVQSAGSNIVIRAATVRSTVGSRLANNEFAQRDAVVFVYLEDGATVRGGENAVVGRGLAVVVVLDQEIIDAGRKLVDSAISVVKSSLGSEIGRLRGVSYDSAGTKDRARCVGSIGDPLNRALTERPPPVNPPPKFSKSKSTPSKWFATAHFATVLP